MDRAVPRFTFIGPSSTTAPSQQSPNVTDDADEKRTNVLRWQAFGVELNHHRVPSHSTRTNTSETNVFDVAALTKTPPRGTREDGRPSASGRLPHSTGDRTHALLNDVVTPPRHRAGALTSARPSSSVVAPNTYASSASSRIAHSGEAHRAVPDYMSLLAQDDQYVAQVASSMQWLTTPSSTPVANRKHTADAPRSAPASAWTAAWNVPAPSSQKPPLQQGPSAPSTTTRAPLRDVVSLAPTVTITTAQPDTSQPPPSAPPSTTADAAEVNPLLRNLHSLSARVASVTELQRCGPPRKASSGAGGGGGGGGRPAFMKKGKKPNKGGAAAGADDETAEDSLTHKGEAHEGGDGGDEHTSRDDTSPSAAADGAGKKRARAKPKPKKAATAKTSERLHPWLPQHDASGTAGAAGGGNATRTRLPFYGAPANGGSEVGDLTRAGAAGSVPLVAAVPYEVLHDTHRLFHDVQTALNDPDRIQAPPLFVGFSSSAASGLYSNFSISSVWGGKVHMMPNVDPRQAHRCVDWFVIRWRDAVYMLATHLALPFLLRVLEELVGVELITFHAPALMLVLLSFLDGAPLRTHCVSDVRVMAWMCMSVQSAGTTSASAAARTTAAAPTERRGGAGMEELCDVNKLFISHLNKQVLAPLPSSKPTASSSTAHSKGDKDEEDAFLQALVNQVYYLSPLYRALYGQLGMRGLLQAFIRQEKGIAVLLATMKRQGMLVDMDAVRKFQRLCLEEMRTWREKAEALVPGLMPGFNLQSPDQCRRALYEELQLGRYLLEPGGEDGGQAGPPGWASSAATAPSLAITKTGKLSTAEETLRQLAPHHPFPLYLLRYRKAAKLLQTYVEGMMKTYALPCAAPDTTARTDDTTHRGSLEAGSDLFSDAMVMDNRPAAQVEEVTGVEADSAEGTEALLPTTRYARVHANFLQEGTDTGRLSCAEPNLQNLPRPTAATIAPSAFDTQTETKEGDEGGGEEAAAEDERAFRRCFIAPPGHVLVSVDYEQIELRVLAHLCADHALVDALTHSVDIHSAIAQQVFKKPTVTPEERSLAKRVVFGVLYGAGPRTLAAQMGVSVERAIHVSALLRNAYPHIDIYHQRVLQQARADGFVRTLSGRLRALPDVTSGVMGKRAYAERQAFNTVVQGTAADVMKLSMLSVDRHVLQVWPREVQLLSQIHDELVLSVDKAKLAEVVPALVSAMTQATTLLVPLRVAVKYGPTLGDLQLWTVDHDLGVAVL